VFDISEKSLKVLPEISTLVSSANKMGSGKVFVVGGRSFICIMKSIGPKVDPWGTPCFTILHSEENSCNDFISVFCFLSDGI
jgi:hypothetical protein